MTSKQKKSSVANTQMSHAPISHMPVSHVAMGSEEGGVTDYKNENILFRIHSPTKDENYIAKSFPAKFSINISKQASQQGPNSYVAQGNRALQRAQGDDGQDDGQYIRELQSLLHDNEQNNNALGYKLHALEQQNIDIRTSLYQSKKEDGEQKQKVKSLENQIARLKEKLAALLQDEKGKDKTIEELQCLLRQKESLILQISRANDVGYLKMMQDQQNQVGLEVKRMDKWLKGLQKITKSTPKNQQDYSAEMQQFLRKFQLISRLNADLQARNQHISESLSDKNREIGRLKDQIRQLLQAGSNNQHCFSGLSNQQQNPRVQQTAQMCIEERDGIVKIKMDLLLIEKDKRISTLEQELQSIKYSILDYKNEIHRLNYRNGHLEGLMRVYHQPHQIGRLYQCHNEYDLLKCHKARECCRDPRKSSVYGIDYDLYQEKMKRAKSIDFDRLSSLDHQFQKSGKIQTNEGRSGSRSTEQKPIGSPRYGSGRQIQKFQHYRQITQRIHQ